jgi:hypothetical protein
LKTHNLAADYPKARSRAKRIRIFELIRRKFKQALWLCSRDSQTLKVDSFS